MRLLRVWPTLLLLPLSFGAMSGGGGASVSARAARTEVVSWHPFDTSGRVKKTLVIKTRPNGSCWSTGSEGIGGIGYRCGHGNFIVDPCWRDGPGATDFVVCAEDPWTRTVDRLRSPHLLLEQGVTFGSADDVPWGIELAKGDRCTRAQGARDAVSGLEGGLIVDYYCDSDLVLLRNLRRTPGLWRIGSARYRHGRYKLLGDVRVRRAFLGGLPPELNRQNVAAREAAVQAERIGLRKVRRRFPRDRLGYHHPSRVRLSLPAATWVRVDGFAFVAGTIRSHDWRVVLQRIDRRWVEAADRRPYCEKLPPRVRRQLFTAIECRR